MLAAGKAPPQYLWSQTVSREGNELVPVQLQYRRRIAGNGAADRLEKAGQPIFRSERRGQIERDREKWV